MPRLLPSLKVRIALITTVLAAILGGGIVIGSLYFAHLDLEDALQNQQDSIVKLSVDQLDTAMDDRIELLSHLAPQLRDTLASAHEQPHDAVRAALQQAIDRTIPMPEAFNAVMVVDAAGTVLTMDGKPVEVGDRAYFLEAIRTRNVVVAAPIRSRVGGYVGVLVAVPVLSSSGEFLGVAGAGSTLPTRTSWWKSPTTGWAPRASTVWCRPAANPSMSSIRTPPWRANPPTPLARPAAWTITARRWNFSPRPGP
jgi:hypothetical protein